MVLKWAAAMGLAALTAGCASTQPQSAQGPKNILLFVADGMGINTMTAARIFAVGEEGQLALDALPEAAYVKTYSANMQASDGAAAMSAYLSGEKTANGVLAMSDCGTPQARAVPTLLELAKQRGLAAGIVSNGSVTDAFSAAGYFHHCPTGLRPAAAQAGGLAQSAAAALTPGGAGYNAALGSGLDVVLGGGARDFGQRVDGRNLLSELRAKGYVQATNLTELNALKPAAGQRLLGLFADEALVAGSARDASRQPSLAQMTQRAIAGLSSNGKGFLLVVGNRHIEKALADSSARTALEEVQAFDQALQAAIDEMQRRDPGLKNTLIVATSTHDSTLVLNGYSRRTGKTTLQEPGVLGLLKRYGDGKQAKDLDGAPYTIIGFGSGGKRVQGPRNSGPALDDATVSASGYAQEAVVRTAPGSATPGGTDVWLGAIGARAEDFRGTIDNTRVFNLIRNAAGW
ncbi:alkaline phosphatase [Pseudoduganella violacea]|uniref:Alkaline phosphatase n=1 Tax=Pseudoduganella violacea TaxID=1715466 RepID=A0A7W5FV87_9BURK|nr:alkaline phosphatase [Pseudoduganella violacea]MBB3120559.1 alkaline phosphatase [Pseudoduganella violacea]